MAEPTLKDVLNAIAQIRGEMATKVEVNERFERVDRRQAEMATKAEMNERFERVDRRQAEMATKAEMNERFDRVDKRLDAIQNQLDDVDADVTKHMKVHAALEKDVEALKRRPLRTAARAPRRRG